VAHNQFSDWTESEHAQIVPEQGVFEHIQQDVAVEPVQLFASNSNSKGVDLRAVGAISPVRSQGNCSASWAFTASGALESFQYMRYYDFEKQTAT